ncbi:ribose-phosphate diphosphokinase [Nisaea sp.]|uniref:ribose-phosphate diphosphokinase n=1 Tax=Nisaea sp. TaxID=2024842 RepID=UPI003B5253FB
MILVAFPDMVALTDRIARQLSARACPLEWHHFPDGESLVTLPDGLANADVAIVACLRNPDRIALPLRFAAETARELGAARVGLIAPYMSYMRQDARFQPGQAVSAPLFARFLGESFDWLVTVDPHLHRIVRLEEIFPIPAIRVPTASQIAAWIVRDTPDALLVGPDSESQQWVAEVAKMAGRPHEVLQKTRTGDRNVQLSVPQHVDFSVGTPVILDDIASSGRTMVQAVERVLAAGAKPPVCVLIHAVFAGTAYEDIAEAGAACTVTTDTIPHVSNSISIAEHIADAVQQVVLSKPVKGA